MKVIYIAMLIIYDICLILINRDIYKTREKLKIWDFNKEQLFINDFIISIIPVVCIIIGALN